MLHLLHDNDPLCDYSLMQYGHLIVLPKVPIGKVFSNIGLEISGQPLTCWHLTTVGVQTFFQRLTLLNFGREPGSSGYGRRLVL